MSKVGFMRGSVMNQNKLLEMVFQQLETPEEKRRVHILQLGNGKCFHGYCRSLRVGNGGIWICLAHAKTGERREFSAEAICAFMEFSL